MKVSLFNKFGARNSPPVFDAIRTGLQNLGHVCTEHDMQADAAVIWSVVWNGRMKSNHEVWKLFRSTHRPVMVAEVGMIQRGHTWKVGLNGTWSGCYNNIDLDASRPEALGLSLDAWRSSGSNIVIATQRCDSEQWAGQPPINQWVDSTVREIRSYTDRPIVIRTHPRQAVSIPKGCKHQVPIKIPNTYDDFDFDWALKQTWAVINWNSGPGSQAIMRGIPAFVGTSSLAAPVANTDLKNIEKPLRPERQQWLIELSHTEWTLEEIRTGLPISRLEPF